MLDLQWALVVGGCLYLLGRAIDRATDRAVGRLHADNFSRQAATERSTERGTVATIVTLLAAERLSNTEVNSELATLRAAESKMFGFHLGETNEEAAIRKEKTREIEALIAERDVLRHSGRVKLVELGWDIYDQVSRSQAAREKEQ